MKVLPRRRKAVLLNSVLATALLATGGIAWATVAQGSSSTGSATTRTATVQRGTVLATVSGSGTLTSPSDAGVNFTTGGTLTEVDVKAGQKVTAGQVLGKVDATSADETLSNAQAQLSSAQANLTQVEAGTTPAASSNNGGGNGGSGSNGGGSTGGRGSATSSTPTPAPTPTVNQAQLASAEQQVTSAENSVAAAQRAVDGTVLKAPVSGTVASVGGKVGDTVSGTGGSGSGSGSGGSGGGSSSSSSSSSSSLSGFVVITNPSGMEVSADFSESDALKLKAGQAATVTLNADTSQVLNAKLVSISSLPVSSSGSGSSSSGAVQYAALLAITGDTANLRTGLSASVQVVTGEASGALYLPTSAINGTGANASVNIVQADGTTKRTPVTLGVQGDSDDQILTGVNDGDKVAITVVSTSGSNGFPSTGFPGGGGGGRGFGGGGGGFGGGGGGRGTGGGGGGRG
ncbi:macrolide-specific efflux system membrane fusion protein [Streptacidiphilus sp. MAP12-33]|uniref:efflux RND transporter periplasmic adaptor subunit n=1 Tax=Streptacidiphilus sp. MAP12-33 TaxID=3156266 RepID=UPI0035138A90